MMYLPLYERGKPQGTITERRASLIGWVHAIFRMSDVIASLYGEKHPHHRLRFTTACQQPEALLYRSTGQRPQHRPRLQANEYLVVANHNWTCPCHHRRPSPPSSAAMPNTSSRPPASP
jgi:hypothetical protein